MMELNREQVIRDLQEVVDNYSGSWKRFNVLDNALALIKELTEENEKLKERLDREARCQYNLCGQIVDLRDDVKYIKADTVQKFANYLKKHSFMCDPGNGHSFDAIDVDELDDYVKEFLGE